MNEITLIQGLLITLIAIITGLDFWFEGFFIFRPIIVATLVGFVLGDLKLGLIVGGLTELIFSGLTPAGGVQPPNPVLGAIMATVLTHISNVDPKAGIALALPFSILMQYIILLYYSTFSFAMKAASKAAKEADVKTIRNINISLTVIVSLSYGVVTFLCAYLAQEPMKNLVHSMPAWLTHGFEVAGGILPAVGFGILLKILLKKENIAYFIIGFLLVVYGSFKNLLPVALIGTALALLHFFNTRSASDKDTNKEVSNGI